MFTRHHKYCEKPATWKIQLTIANNFISSIDNDKDHAIPSKSDNIEITITDEADKVIKNVFDWVKNGYQNDLELMKSSEFVFDYIVLLYYKWHRIKPNRGGSYIHSSDSIKKATLSHINKKDNKFF